MEKSCDIQLKLMLPELLKNVTSLTGRAVMGSSYRQDGWSPGCSNGNHKLELLPDMMIIQQIFLPQISSFLGHFFSTTFITYFQCEILKTNTVLSILTIFSWICLLIILFTEVGQLVIQKCRSVRLLRELCSVHFIYIYFNVNCTTVRQADLKDNLDNRPNGYLLVRS